jgi:hypothetical protein
MSTVKSGLLLVFRRVRGHLRGDVETLILDCRRGLGTDILGLEGAMVELRLPAS